MVLNLLLILLLAIIYGFATEDPRLIAAASNIHQFLTGCCHLVCRQSDNSDCGNAGVNTDNLLQNTTARTDAGPSRCFCVTCPCVLFENLYRICSPEIQICSDIINIVSNFSNEFMRMITETYTYIEGVYERCVRESRLPKQIPVQINEVGPKEKPKVRAVISEANSVVSKSLKSAMDSVQINEGPSQIKAEPPNSKESSQTVVKKTCSKCRIKGQVCMPECPSVKKKQK